MADESLPLLSDQPGPDYVPYTTSRTVPGQPPVTTTGYGLRARPPLQPPSPGAPGIPDMSGMMRSAFEQLPVDEAIRVTNAVQQSMGQRLFAKAVQSGTPIPQAWATYGRMMFAGQNPGSAGFTGPPQITPFQQQELKIRKAQEARAAAAAVKPKIHYGQSGEIVQENTDGSYQVLRHPVPKKPTKTVTTEFPAVEGSPAIPATPRSGFLWTTPGQPAIPPRPASPKRTVRETVQGDEEIPGKEEEATPIEETPTAPAVAAPVVAKRVRVKDKANKFYTVPENQLEAAIAQGYTEVK